MKVGRSRRGLGQAALLLTDQVISSLSNVLMPLLIAGLATRDQFGYFVTGYAAFALAQTISRNTLSVHVSMASGSDADVRREVGLALWILVAVAPLVVVGVAAVPVLAGSRLQPLYLIFAVGAAIALAQDVLRYGAVARVRVGSVLLSDGAWLLVILAAIPARLKGWDSPTIVGALWMLGALIGLVILLPGAATFCSPRIVFDLWSEHARARSSLVMASVTSSGSVLLGSIIIARLAGPQAMAALGGAGQLMAPINLAIAFIGLGLMPLAARRGIIWSRRAFAGVALVIPAMAVGWGVLLAVLPNQLGVLLLGNSWALAETVLWPVALSTAAVAAGSAGTSLLIRLHEEGWVARLRVSQGLARLVIAAVVAATLGTAFSLATAELLLTACFALGVWLVGWSISRDMARANAQRDR